MGRLFVDSLTLGRWRELDALLMLEKLESYVKADDTFEPLSTHGTQRYHINVEGRDFELLLRGPKFFDTRLQRGGLPWACMCATSISKTQLTCPDVLGSPCS